MDFKNILLNLGTGGYGELFGILMGLSAGFFYACIIMTSRHLRTEYTGLSQLFLSTGITLILLLPYAAKVFPDVLLGNLPIILFLGVMTTSIGSILYFTGLMHIKAQNASIISLLEPVSTIFFAYVLLNEPISLTTMLGCALILTGSLLMSLEGYEDQGQEASEKM